VADHDGRWLALAAVFAMNAASSMCASESSFCMHLAQGQEIWEQNALVLCHSHVLRKRGKQYLLRSRTKHPRRAGTSPCRYLAAPESR
jgi:hypothetical protein